VVVKSRPDINLRRPGKYVLTELRYHPCRANSVYFRLPFTGWDSVDAARPQLVQASGSARGGVNCAIRSVA